jgi:uncharacterized protein YqhQ
VPKGEYLQYGGLAIIEGVMMRSPKHFSVACRAPNGQIVLHSEPVEKGWFAKQRWLKLPFFRGPFALIDSFALGNRAITFASNVQLDPQYAAVPADEKSAEGSGVYHTEQHGHSKLQSAAIGVLSLVSIAVMVAIFMFLPQVLGEQLRSAGVTNERLLNLASGTIKLILFISYVSLIRRLKSIYRVFQYHGAEHKAINTMEAGEELTMENCRKQTRLHPRCGTNFAVIVLLLDIAVMTFVMRYPLGYGQVHYLVNLAIRALINVPILILVSGVAYEMIRLAGRFRSSWLVNIFFFPGLLTQYITTAPPEDDQIEVALVALREVMKEEEGEKPSEPEDQGQPVTL